MISSLLNNLALHTFIMDIKAFTSNDKAAVILSVDVNEALNTKATKALDSIKTANYVFRA